MRAIDPATIEQQAGLATILDNLARAFDNVALSSPGMTQGSSSNVKLKAANTTTYRCGGLILSKTTFEVAFTAGAADWSGVHDVSPNANSVQERVFVVCLDASGTPTIIAGDQATGSGNALYPDITGAVPALAAGPGGSIVGAGYPASQSNATYPTGITATPLKLRNNSLTPIGGVRIAVAAGATGFEAGTDQPATAGAITATYFNGYPTPQIITAQ